MSSIPPNVSALPSFGSHIARYRLAEDLESESRPNGGITEVSKSRNMSPILLADGRVQLIQGTEFYLIVNTPNG
jgi:hypothetical protein